MNDMDIYIYTYRSYGLFSINDMDDSLGHQTLLRQGLDDAIADIHKEPHWGHVLWHAGGW